MHHIHDTGVCPLWRLGVGAGAFGVGAVPDCSASQLFGERGRRSTLLQNLPFFCILDPALLLGSML